MLRRRKSTPVLYWHLKRPRAHVYAGAVARLVIYRLVAAAAAILAIMLLAFVGAVAGNIGYPHWPALKSISGGMINLATVHATAELSHWVPAFLALGLALVIIPRPHQWLFRITMVSGAALGYYQRRLPPFPHSTMANDIIRQAASLAGRITLPVSAKSLSTAIAPLAIVALIGYILYRSSYTLTMRTMSFIPRRPINHYRSTFRAVSVTRRLMAVPVTAGLLAVSLWIVENIRILLHITRIDVFLLWHSQPSPGEWLLVTVAVALIICTPRPQGYPLLLIALLVALTVYALWPYQSLFPMPTGILAAPGSFWMLAVAYLLVTGLAFDLVAALLDWRI